MEVKQVLIIRKDLKMRRGKEIAQGAHASCSFLIKKLGKDLTKEEKWWIENGQKKITVTVNSEEELVELYNQAKNNKLNCSLITDSGKTEFKGEPTKTALSIGPNLSSDIDKLTGGLPLY